MTSPLAAIANLRRAVAVLLDSGDDGARCVGQRLQTYLADAKVGADLLVCLDLATMNGAWWRVEGRRTRDAALRELAQAWPDKKIAGRAYEIERLTYRYAASAWRFDQGRADMPPSYIGTPREALWKAFKSGADMPLKKRQLQTILSEKCNGGAVAIAFDAPDDDQTTEGDPHGARAATKACRVD